MLTVEGFPPLLFALSELHKPNAKFDGQPCNAII